MKRYVAGLMSTLVILGLLTAVGPDGIALAQDACTSEGAVPPSETVLAADCEVLLDIRDTISGTAPLSWSAEMPIEDWEGISVGGTPSRVIGVWLSDRGMDGILPSRLGELRGLERLWLWNNELSGTIPGELGDLTNLTELWLNGNQLSGAIPSELGNLSSLTTLGLGFNELNGAIPSELGNLSNLTTLSLSANELNGAIPSELGNLSNLTELDLSGNELSDAIPSELGNLSNLTALWVQANELSGAIPLELGNLSNLTTLGLGGNQLSGAIPPELSNLSNLTALGLELNRLSGALPDSLTRLTSLGHLAFHSNVDVCAPVDSAFQAWLQAIDYVYGSSCAPVDSEEDKAVLASLYGATGGANWEDKSNWLSSRPIREWYGVTSDAGGRVTGLYLWENQLSGTIPPELGNLSELFWLNMRDNQLTGSVPPELGKLSSLRGLYLRNNQLTGCIPASLQGVESNDFDRLFLPFCDMSLVLNGLRILPGELNQQFEPYRTSYTAVSDATTVTIEADAGVGVTPRYLDNLSRRQADADVETPGHQVGLKAGVTFARVRLESVDGEEERTYTILIASGELFRQYDVNENREIDRDEVLMAVRDYFDGLLTRDEVIGMVQLYFFP